MIDYADLYDVRHGETDFFGAIERLKEKDYPIKHLDKEYLDIVIHLNKEYLEFK